jgi:hypothetical protein
MTSHILNLFPVENLAGLSCEYRLLEVSNLPKDTQYAENLQRLATMVSKETRKPVSLYKSGGQTFLATTATTERLKSQWRLIPHVAVLKPLEGSRRLNYNNLSPEQVDLALNLLRYDVRTALARKPDLWNDNANSFYKRTPAALSGEGGVDVLDGFFFSLHYLPDGKIYVAVDPTVKYMDHLSLADRLKNGENFDDFKFQHFVYRNGHQRYRVQLMALAGNSISEQLFVHQSDDKTYNVFDWIKQSFRGPSLDIIEHLDPNSPAILYRYPQGGKKFSGAAALCFKTYHPEAPEVRALHSLSLMPPGERLQWSKNIVRKYLRDVRFCAGGTFAISDRPLTKAAEYFDPPDLLYAKNKVLHVRRNGEEGISLKEYGKKRMDYLQKHIGGLLVQDSFQMQYMFVPLSLHRSIVKEFKDDFVAQIERVYPHGYTIKIIVYDDRSARNLSQQVAAIKKAVEDNRIDRGAALLVLPENAKRDLHNFIKRELFETLHFQCAQASSLKRYFRRDGDGYEVNPDMTGKYLSYVRNTAIGLLLVNHKWPFALKTPLNYDLPYGIDVLNSMAGFTYAYNGGKDCYFRHSRSTQGEKLSKGQVLKMLYNDLRRDVPRLGLKPKAIVQHRDGNTHAEEIEGMAEAVRRLQSEGVLDEGLIVGTTKIHKSSTSHLRLYEEQNGEIRNPRIGSYFALNEHQGIVCNTGYPFSFPGTVKPLLATIADGGLEIEKVLADIFALSQLAWTAPDKASRHPITTKLGDMFLRPIASAADEEEARYGDEDETAEGDENTESEEVLTRSAKAR